MARHGWIACRGVDEYVGAAAYASAGERIVVPAIDAAGTAFPSDVERIPLADIDALDGLPAAPPDPPRLCVAFDDALCLAIATVLGRTTGKVLTLQREEAWSVRGLEELLGANDGVASVTLVLPPFGRGYPSGNRERVQRLVDAMRRVRWPHDARRWGVITARTAAAMTLLAAKSALRESFAARYSGAPPAVVYGDAAPTGAARPPEPPAEGRSSDAPDGIVRMYNSALSRKTIGAVLAQPFPFLWIEGHGRSYCVNEGLLCGARGDGDLGSEPGDECLPGHRCLTPEHLRVDPRRFDARIVFIDCCEVANLATVAAEGGFAPLAFLAAESPSSAVIATDVITIKSGVKPLHVFGPLGAAATVGELAALLNETERERNLEQPYFVIGDPELPLALEARPWFAEVRAEDGVMALEAGRASYVRAELVPRPSASHSLFIDAGEDVRLTDAVSGVGYCWLAIDAPDAAARTIAAAWRETPSLPPLLAEGARSAIAGAPAVHERLEPYWQGVAAAAAHLGDVQLDLQSIAGRIVPDTKRAVVRDAVSLWLEAQLACVRAVAESPETVWPHELWSATGFRTVHADEACGVCGRADTIRRAYASAAASREWLECRRCRITADVPLAASLPQIALAGPDRIAIGDQFRCTLTIDNSSGASVCLGAGHVRIDGLRHGGRTTPATFPIAIPPGDGATIKIDVSVAEDAAPANLHALRAVLLLGGQWLWESRPLAVIVPAELPAGVVLR